MDKKVIARDRGTIYNGDVKITFLHGKKKYKVIKQHNYGTDAFFNYILNSIKGEYLVRQRPGIIIPCSDDNGVSPAITIPVVYESISGPTSNELTYSFLIPETIIQNITIGSFILKDITNTYTYAVLKLDNIITIDSSTNLLVEWKLKIDNGPVGLEI